MPIFSIVCGLYYPSTLWIHPPLSLAEAFEIPGLQARPYHDDELQVPLGRFFIF
jgi:hypothetical protein